MTPPRVLFAGIVLLGVCLAGAAGQGTSCEPSCPTYCTPGDLVPNPLNCQQYYMCLDDCLPSDAIFDCPEGDTFDAATAECQPDDGNTTCGYCLPRCKYTCEGHTGFAANREDCHTASICMTDPPLTLACGDQWFNGTGCQDDEAQCCDPCVVFCEEPFTQIMDPESCTSFYFCMEVGYPQPEDKFECPDGEVFEDGHCREQDGTEDCYQPCSAATTTTAPTATTETAAFAPRPGSTPSA